MSDQTTEAETTQEQDHEQTETADQSGESVAELKEQLQQMQKQLEETRKAQSGSDKQVQELRKQLEQKEQEVEQASKTAEEQWRERLEALEKKHQEAEQRATFEARRNEAIQMLSEEGLKAPKYIDRLISDDAEETEAAIKDYIEDMKQTQTQAADQYARQHGRKVTDTQKKQSGGTYMDYTDEQIAAMSDKEFQQMMERSRKEG